MYSPRWLSRRFLAWVLGCALLGTLGPAIVQFAMKRFDPYKLAVGTAHSSPEFVDALGAPVAEGWFFEGKEQLGSSARAEMLIPVHGSTRAGNLRVQAIKDGGRWRLTQLTLKLAKPDESIDLLSKKPL